MDEPAREQDVLPPPASPSGGGKLLVRLLCSAVGGALGAVIGNVALGTVGGGVGAGVGAPARQAGVPLPAGSGRVTIRGVPGASRGPQAWAATSGPDASAHPLRLDR